MSEELGWMWRWRFCDKVRFSVKNLGEFSVKNAPSPAKRASRCSRTPTSVSGAAIEDEDDTDKS